MKTIATLLTLIASVSLTYANCGSCSTEGECAECAACHSQTLKSYFSIQSALASDDLASAQAAASELEGKIAKSECSMEGDCCADVTQATGAIAKAETIANAREAFQSLSNALIAQIEEHGSTSKVYEMYCPMAFNNKGGAWLQDHADLKNPYYGSMMLTCGTTKATFGGENAAHESSDHGEQTNKHHH